MEEINKLRIINKLKSVYRSAPIDDRKESSAEHSWSCLLLADYFLGKIEEKLDRVKVYELLMYHDVVEIEAGDTKNGLGVDRSGKKERELIASKKLKEIMPKEMGNKFIDLFEEFEALKTREAKFAKAMDCLDAEINCLDYKKELVGWTEEFFRKIDQKHMGEFPELLVVFEKIVDYLNKEGYFSQ
ncbi:MAG: HD domain-containing protein [Nanoarchaeota archaeon]|nr:HD domain-containing protein [Nanoarchaeota archaeon]